ncbi:MAG TPA: ComF family protein [Methylomirabilota bacterium]|nr:ComF family protein [Methylomirabilota bacterium]
MPPLEHVAPVAPLAPAWRTWAEALLDLVFPPFCPVCRERLGAGRRDPLCGACWDRLERIGPPWCHLCGRPFGAFQTDRVSADWGRAGACPSPPQMIVGAESSRAHLCGPCRRRRPRFYIRSAARYGETVREAVHAFKFGGRRALAVPLGDLLAGIGRERLPVGKEPVLLPVPLHRRRERERGFNQSRLLAERVGRAWSVPVLAGALERVVATATQTDLPAKARRANVRGAFVVRRPELVAGRHVVLVDDIYTTGATATECVRCLRKAGAGELGVLTLARVL